MSKAVKEMIIGEIRERLGDTKDLLVVDTSRLDPNTDNELRTKLREKGITLLGVKNSLARLALKQNGVEFVDGAFEGPSILCYGGADIVALSREMTEWAKKIDKIQIKGGSVDGQGVDAQGVDELSKGPSREELIGQIAGLILSPGARLAGALLGPGGTISGQLKALADKEGNEEGGDAA
ncbi:MAG: 50S ribosomal protein L10 [Planctomycetaceae bacterium]|nr:50S ribosomal protein L10 [Planctomycetaceae bacterium]